MTTREECPRWLWSTALLGALVPCSAFAADAIAVLEVRVERATVHTAGVQVLISDDDDRDATIDVRVRELGATEWLAAPSLFRVHPETVGIPVPQQLAGSIFDLEPGLQFEVELHMIDPDGVDETQTVIASTRAVPTGPARATPVAVADAATLAAALSAAAPGHVITLAPGTYGGTFALDASGTPTDPIVIRGEDAASVVIDGQGCTGCNVLEIYGSHVHLEDLTLAHGERALRFQGEGATANVVRRVIMEDVQHGIGSRASQADFYVCDNAIRGRLSWPWVFADDASSHWDDRGVDLNGDGHVVCHNLIQGFGDPIVNLTEGYRAFDVYGNEIIDCFDGIETDRGTGNIRVFRNRWTNVDSAISIQPINGGPLYVVRNELVNVVSEQIKMKMTGGEPSGSIIVHNTFVSGDLALNLQTPITGHNFVIENNLFVGPAVLSGARTVEWTAGVDGGVFDANGYFPDGGFWFGVVRGTNRLYDSLAAAMASGDVEGAGVLLGEPIFAAGLVGPVDEMVAATPVELDLADGSNAIDAGHVWPGIGDAFEGAGPDLGARERGCAAPGFGPRPSDEEHVVARVNCPSATPGGDDDGGSDTGDEGGADETGSGASGADAGDSSAGADAGAGSASSSAATDSGDASQADGGGCACSATPRGSAWWLALLMIARRRKRLPRIGVMIVLAFVACGDDTSSGDESTSGSAGSDGPGAPSSSSSGMDASSLDSTSGSTGVDDTTGSSSSGDATSSTTADEGSSSGTDTGEAVCELDPIGPALGTVEQAWAVGPYTAPEGIAADSAGNVVIVGMFDGADFGDGFIDAGEASFVAKYDGTGALAWVEVLAGAAPSTISVAIDASDDVLVAGGFGAGKVVKLDGATGATLWTSDAGMEFYVDDVATMPDGDVVIVETPSAQNVPSMVYRLDSVDGTEVWAAPVGQPLAFGDFTQGRAIAANGEHVIWGGYFAGMIATPGGHVSSQDGGWNFALVALDVDDGSPLWAYAAFAPIVLQLGDVAVDPCGGAYAYGWLQGTMEAGFDDELLGFEDPFLIRLDAGGSPEWAHLFPVMGFPGVGGIAVDPEGSALVTGRASSIDFGAGVVSAPSDSGFLAKLDRDGNVQWGHLFPGAFISYTQGAAVDGQGDAWVVGLLNNEVDIAGTTVTVGKALFPASYVGRFTP